eukprot:3204096-Heterocapsa_arctica.AAC.1
MVGGAGWRCRGAGRPMATGRKAVPVEAHAGDCSSGLRWSRRGRRLQRRCAGRVTTAAMARAGRVTTTLVDGLAM